MRALRVCLWFVYVTSGPRRFVFRASRALPLSPPPLSLSLFLRRASRFYCDALSFSRCSSCIYAYTPHLVLRRARSYIFHIVFSVFFRCASSSLVINVSPFSASASVFVSAVSRSFLFPMGACNFVYFSGIPHACAGATRTRVSSRQVENF